MHPHKTSIPWAILRIVLGTTQIVGGMTTAILLLKTGVNEMTVGGIALVACVTVLSRWLFRDSGQSRL